MDQPSTAIELKESKRSRMLSFVLKLNLAFKKNASQVPDAQPTAFATRYWSSSVLQKTQKFRLCRPTPLAPIAQQNKTFFLEQEIFHGA
jgi:hypothetical protein